MDLSKLRLRASALEDRALLVLLCHRRRRHPLHPPVALAQRVPHRVVMYRDKPRTRVQQKEGRSRCHHRRVGQRVYRGTQGYGCHCCAHDTNGQYVAVDELLWSGE